MNDAVVARLDKVIQLLSKLPSSEAEPQRKKLSDDSKEQFAETKPKEPREIVKKVTSVRIESYSNEGKKFLSDLSNKASSTKTDKAVAEKKEDGGSFFGKLLKILGGIAIGAVLLKFLLPFIKDKVFPFLIDMFKTVTGFITKYITPLLGPALKSIVKFLTKTLPDVVGKFFKSAVDFFKGVWKSIVDNWPEWKEKILKIWDGLVDFFKGVWKSITDNWPKWKEKILKIWDGLVDFFEGLWESIRTNWYMLWEPKLRALWNDTLVPFFEGVWKSITDNWPKWKEKILKIWGGLVCFFKGVWKSITDNWPEWKTNILKIWGGLVCFFKGLWYSIQEEWEYIWEPQLRALWEDTLVPFFEGVWKSIKETWKKDIEPKLVEFWKNNAVPFFERIWKEYVVEPIKNAFEKKKLQFEAMIGDIYISFIESLEDLAKGIVRSVIPKFLREKLKLGVERADGEDQAEADKNMKRLEGILAAREAKKLEDQKLVPSPQPTDTVNDFISRPGQPTQRFDSTDDVLGYKSDGPINFVSKESLALQKTSVTQNTRIIELLVGTNKLLVELGCSAMQKPSNTTIVNAPKTTSLSYSTSPLQSLFRQGVG